jgi:Flp pilus assembly pilin Flp
MEQNRKAMRRKIRGQGLTEYIIIVAVIAIAAIGVVVAFGDQIKKMFTDSTTQLEAVEPNNGLDDTTPPSF